MPLTTLFWSSWFGMKRGDIDTQERWVTIGFERFEEKFKRKCILAPCKGEFDDTVIAKRIATMLRQSTRIMYIRCPKCNMLYEFMGAGRGRKKRK